MISQQLYYMKVELLIITIIKYNVNRTREQSLKNTIGNWPETCSRKSVRPDLTPDRNLDEFFGGGKMIVK